MGNIFTTSKLYPNSDSDNEALEKANLTEPLTEHLTEPHTEPLTEPLTEPHTERNRTPEPTTTPSPNIGREKERLENDELETKTLRPLTPHPLSYYNDLNRPISKLGKILKESLETADSIPFPVHSYHSVITTPTTSYQFNLNTTNTDPNLNTISEQPTTNTSQTPLLYDQD